MTEHIKIYGVKPRIQYVADGELTTYEFPFAIFDSSDIEVYFADEKQSASTYSVSDVTSEGGSITFSSAPASGTVITILRNLSIKRTSDFQEGASLRANVLNDELDYQIACQQQIAENLNRSMVLPPYAADSNLDLTLPTPSAGKAIVWNAAGTNLENSTVEINALEATLKGYKNAAEAAATTATTKAGVASDKADLATQKAQLASDKADIATQKATEAAGALSSKVNVDADNLSDTGKAAVVALGRQFTNLETLVCSGNGGIAGTYDLSQHLSDTTSVKLGVFRLNLHTTGSGFSSMAIGSDVIINANATGTNNSFTSVGYVVLPFKKEIKISFPSTSGGVGTNSSCLFIGYM